MNLKSEFIRFLESDPERLHFAPHSHHPWPDVSYEAHRQAWVDAADLIDDKWEHIFGTVMPRARQQIASVLRLPRDDSIVFAPNTHEFVLRLFSCFEPPVRILTTDSEFHSFTRQSRRWEEEGLAIVDRVPTEPFPTFVERFAAEVASGVHDMIHLSHVFFDSGVVVPEIDRLASTVPDGRTFFVIDGYHSFMAMPVDLSAIHDRAFYIAGGYKYAMSGEGVCFMHCPPGYGMRPVNTGWYAGFGHLESGMGETLPYPEDGSRFAGATFDPSGIYRMDAVLDWLTAQGVGPDEIHKHSLALQEMFLGALENLPGRLVAPSDMERGNFLTFASSRAAHHYKVLHERRVVTDYRGDRLRIGFGIYHSEHDVERLVRVIEDLGLE
ncbi:MAG TPA: aminotransferase class V-fold PLP-dependent enzyme [Acidimicrobiia bacterium]|nr:aminotransferase class V-fold PLP-dependent enzyme [Acidimicrobiia bacterium]